MEFDQEVIKKNTQPEIAAKKLVTVSCISAITES